MTQTTFNPANQSVRFCVYAAVAAVLDGYRCRFADFSTDELPADNVVPDDDAAEYPDTSGIDHRFRFQVRYTVAVAKDADMIADQRYVRGTRLLMADITLGGLVRRLKEVDVKFERERGELQIMVLVVTYECEFSTTNSDPSVAGY